jgi:hypothetical protein
MVVSFVTFSHHVIFHSCIHQFILPHSFLSSSLYLLLFSRYLILHAFSPFFMCLFTSRHIRDLKFKNASIAFFFRKVCLCFCMMKRPAGESPLENFLVTYLS